MLAALEFTEALDAQGETKAFFGGAMGASAGLYDQFIEEHDNYQKRLAQYATGPSRERRHLKREIARAATKVQELFRKIVAQKVRFRKNARPKKLKMLPYSAMDSVKKRGTKSVYLQDSADIKRVRWVMRGAKVLGAGALLLDAGIAVKKIKHADETGGNTTRVAFQEVGGITLEVMGAGFAAGLTSSGVTALAGLGLALIPGVGLLLIIAAGATGAVLGNMYGKRIGDNLYERIMGDKSLTTNLFGANALNAL